MNLEGIINQVTHPEDVTSRFYPDDMKMNQVSGILASFPVLFWIPLVLAKDSPYGKFCANQGLILFVLELAITVVTSILSRILGLIPLIGGLLNYLVGLLGAVVVTGSFLLLLISACQGIARVIPLVGNMFEAFR